MSERYKKNYSIDGWPIEDSRNETVLHNDDIVLILNNLEAAHDALKIELMRTEAALRSCYNASAGALNLLTSDRQPKLEGQG